MRLPCSSSAGLTPPLRRWSTLGGLSGFWREEEDRERPRVLVHWRPGDLSCWSGLPPGVVPSASFPSWLALCLDVRSSLNVISLLTWNAMRHGLRLSLLLRRSSEHPGSPSDPLNEVLVFPVFPVSRSSTVTCPDEGLLPFIVSCAQWSLLLRSLCSSVVGSFLYPFFDIFPFFFPLFFF